MIVETSYGRYQFHRYDGDRTVWKSMDRANAFVYDLADVPRGHSAPGEGEPSPLPPTHQHNDRVVTAVELLGRDRLYQKTLGGWRPTTGYVVIPILDNSSWWKPCPTRAITDDGTASSDTHVWFVERASSGRVFCYQCRLRRPRVYYRVSGKFTEEERCRLLGIPIETKENDEPGDIAAGGEAVTRVLRDPLDRTAKQVDWSTPLTVVTAGETASSQDAGAVPQAAHPPALAAIPPVPASTFTPKPTEVPLNPDGASPARVSQGTSARAPYIPRTISAWKEEIEERAAIFEYLGGYPRDVAELRARKLVGNMPKVA